MSHLYDYYISLPVNDSFDINLQKAIGLVDSSAGRSPTSNRELVGVSYYQLSKTHPINGIELLHFRMQGRYDEQGIITFLNSVMTPPLPNIVARCIRSVDKIIENEVIEVITEGNVQEGETVGDERITITRDYDLVMKPIEADLSPFFNDGDSEEVWLSTYYGTDPIKVTT